jgi:hypothetical protein
MRGGRRDNLEGDATGRTKLPLALKTGLYPSFEVNP